MSLGEIEEERVNLPTKASEQWLLEERTRKRVAACQFIEARLREPPRERERERRRKRDELAGRTEIYTTETPLLSIRHQS